MRFGLVLPGGTAERQLEQAILAERSGWDGVFVWEAAYGVDAWALLSAMAVRTSRIRLGTMLTPLPWRRPWKVASQVATLDQLSGGRAILALGIGAVTEDLPRTGEELDRKKRAAMIDEGIDLMRALWRGETRFIGTHYRYEFELADQFVVGRPVQPRIPIWIVGVWNRPRSMRRVLRCDGLIPQFAEGPHGGTPDAIRDIRTWLAGHDRAEIDIVHDGETPTGDPRLAQETVRPWAEAGVTWWIESRWEMPHHSEDRMREVEARVAAGPGATRS